MQLLRLGSRNRSGSRSHSGVESTVAEKLAAAKQESNGSEDELEKRESVMETRDDASEIDHRDMDAEDIIENVLESIREKKEAEVNAIDVALAENHALAQEIIAACRGIVGRSSSELSKASTKSKRMSVGRAVKQATGILQRDRSALSASRGAAETDVSILLATEGSYAQTTVAEGQEIRLTTDEVIKELVAGKSADDIAVAREEPPSPPPKLPTGGLERRDVDVLDISMGFMERVICGDETSVPAGHDIKLECIPDAIDDDVDVDHSNTKSGSLEGAIVSTRCDELNVGNQEGEQVVAHEKTDDHETQDPPSTTFCCFGTSVIPEPLPIEVSDLALTEETDEKGEDLGETVQLEADRDVDTQNEPPYAGMGSCEQRFPQSTNDEARDGNEGLEVADLGYAPSSDPGCQLPTMDPVDAALLSCDDRMEVAIADDVVDLQYARTSDPGCVLGPADPVDAAILSCDDNLEVVVDDDYPTFIEVVCCMGGRARAEAVALGEEGDRRDDSVSCENETEAEIDETAEPPTVADRPNAVQQNAPVGKPPLPPKERQSDARSTEAVQNKSRVLSDIRIKVTREPSYVGPMTVPLVSRSSSAMAGIGEAGASSADVERIPLDTVDSQFLVVASSSGDGSAVEMELVSGNDDSGEQVEKYEVVQKKGSWKQRLVPRVFMSALRMATKAVPSENQAEGNEEGTSESSSYASTRASRTTAQTDVDPERDIDRTLDEFSSDDEEANADMIDELVAQISHSMSAGLATGFGDDDDNDDEY